MTNYERLLDLPFREVLKEFNSLSRARVTEFFGIRVNCTENFPSCSFCGDVEHGSCSTVFDYWLGHESAPDANYNEDVWHDASEEDPPTSDTTVEYLVLISGAELPTTLTFDGDEWLDPYDNIYVVKYWRPMPKLPEEVSNNAD